MCLCNGSVETINFIGHKVKSERVLKGTDVNLITKERLDSSVITHGMFRSTVIWLGLIFVSYEQLKCSVPENPIAMPLTWLTNKYEQVLLLTKSISTLKLLKGALALLPNNLTNL